jgi:hypothetical protein
MRPVRVLGGYTSRMKLVIAKRRPEAYWPEERWGFSASRGMTMDVDVLLVTPLFSCASWG